MPTASDTATETTPNPTAAATAAAAPTPTPVTDTPVTNAPSTNTPDHQSTNTLEAPLRADSSAVDAVRAFDEYMLRKGFSENTIKAFNNDLKIVVEYLGPETRLAQVGTSDLNEFLDWLQHKRGKPCSAKTLARRITTLKVFFGWLHGIGIIGTDPAEPVVQQTARPPLPEILTDGELNQLLATARDMTLDRKHPDSRPYLLLMLLSQTGMKKAEVARLLASDIGGSSVGSLEVTIRYSDEAHAHKNRTLPLNASFPPVWNQYQREYKPETFVFDCTPRNLEYVLEELGEKAGIKRLQIGFESLRWTSAVRDYRMGTPEERLRQKMGLSKISWRETREKIQTLANNR